MLDLIGPALNGAQSKLFRAPAVQAALIQVVAVAATIAVIYVSARLDHPIPVYVAALLQGVAAASITYIRGLAPWWRAIQFVFPVALVAGDALHPPPAVLLSVFLLMLALFWSTFRTQVPFYPSAPAVRQAVAALLPLDRSVRLIDIGSGLGDLVLDLAKRCPGSQFSGVEVAPLPWLLSTLRARLSRSRARFKRGDYERLNFADYDVVFAYLSPAVMASLWHKAKNEMRPATMLVSYEFGIPGHEPNATVRAAPGGPPLHVWYF